jgi:hypothetical protein
VGCGFLEEAEKTMKGERDDASTTEALSEPTPERTSTLSAELTHSNNNTLGGIFLVTSAP